ncbi:MAG TPA: hypothetical protein VE547_10730 [Mycobacteriales bacterium]|nr:hypothetical protein [Mycobacteriales bacterium]
MAERQPELVTPEQIRAAVGQLEQRRAAGMLTETELARRVNDCRRAVTPRDLWKASGGLAGDRRRQDWWDIRRAVAGLLFILVLAALGMWLVTWTMGLVEGDGEPPVTPASLALAAAPPSW